MRNSLFQQALMGLLVKRKPPAFHHLLLKQSGARRKLGKEEIDVSRPICPTGSGYWQYCLWSPGVIGILQEVPTENPLPVSGLGTIGIMIPKLSEPLAVSY